MTNKNVRLNSSFWEVVRKVCSQKKVFRTAKAI